MTRLQTYRGVKDRYIDDGKVATLLQKEGGFHKKNIGGKAVLDVFYFI